MHKILLVAGALVFGAATVQAQCTEWVNPTPEGGWTDFDPAPCNGATQEITAFEVWQSEAYQMEGILAGGNYTFSHCNGASGTWTPEYTIIAPSGAVDAFGAGDGDGCSITWTASEEGTYLIVINEANNCGVEGSDNNGFPAITTNSGGAPCAEEPVFIEGSESFESTDLPECWIVVDADGDGTNWAASDLLGGFDGDFSILSRSWDGEPLTPDNWIITPQVEVGANDSLYFLVRAFDPGFFQENYSVLISTTGNSAPSDFTTVAFTETLDNNGWNARSIDMSAYAGQNVYIAFRHHDVVDVNALQIDGVHLPGENLCGISSTSENELIGSINIFPNPSAGLFNIANNGQTDVFQIQVYDINGRIVREERVTLNSGSIHPIDLSSEAAGIYTTRFIGTERSGSFRVVVK
jgi:hypothetical protein